MHKTHEVRPFPSKRGRITCTKVLPFSCRKSLMHIHSHSSSAIHSTRRQLQFMQFELFQALRCNCIENCCGSICIFIAADGAGSARCCQLLHGAFAPFCLTDDDWLGRVQPNNSLGSTGGISVMSAAIRMVGCNGFSQSSPAR